MRVFDRRISHPSATWNCDGKTFATPSCTKEGIAIGWVSSITPLGDMPLIIRVAPSKPSRLIVSVRRNSVPTSEHYDWQLTSRENYTLFVPENLTVGVEQLYVRVQGIPGMSRHTSGANEEHSRTETGILKPTLEIISICCCLSLLFMHTLLLRKRAVLPA